MNDIKFTYKQQVKIVKGFYRGKYATIQDYKVLEKLFVADVKLDKDNQKTMNFTAEELREVKTFLPFK